MANFAFCRTAGAALAAFALLALPCASASAANVVLKDGTVIHGKIESLQNGVYTVRTDSLGTVRVRQQQVRSIDENDGAAKPSSSASAAGENSSAQGAALQNVQLGILQDPKLLQLLLGLQNDPEMQAILADPDLMRKVAAGDYGALKNDPKIVALMRDDRMRAILDALH